MKKYLLSLALLGTVVLGVSAQSSNTAGGCYRGFVDAGYTVGIGDYEFGRFEVNTSHGYQINPYFYVGAGVGFHFMPSYETPDMDIPLDKRDSKVDIPVFANARINFSKSKVTPFIDAKGGTYVTNNGGLYVNGSAGIRIACNGKQAINIMVGYTLEKLEFETFWKFNNTHSMSYTRKPTTYETEGVSLKIGYEF
jgi:hypothetical protein